VTDDDGPWLPSRGLSLAPARLVALEEALGPERVVAVADVGGETTAVILDDADEDAPFLVVRVDGVDPVSWTELSRHEWWSEEEDCASGALAAHLDARRSQLNVHAPGAAIVPALALPRRHGIEVLYLTPDGVAATIQLFENPNEPIDDEQRWATFQEAVDWLTYEI
jgi:hypothetical protein